MRGASLTRRVRFSARHRYWRPEWDAARNGSTFGDCAAPEPHGHDYICDVTVSGPLHPETGMVLDLGILDALLLDQVVTPLHGSVVNEAFAEFAPGGLIPTCEELARVIATRISVALQARAVPAKVASVRVAEDDTLSATWTNAV